jgi:hypothetical protein
MQVSIFQSNVNKWYFLMQKKLPSHYLKYKFMVLKVGRKTGTKDHRAD